MKYMFFTIIFLLPLISHAVFQEKLDNKINNLYTFYQENKFNDLIKQAEKSKNKEDKKNIDRALEMMEKLKSEDW